MSKRTLTAWWAHLPFLLKQWRFLSTKLCMFKTKVHLKYPRGLKTALYCEMTKTLLSTPFPRWLQRYKLLPHAFISCLFFHHSSKKRNKMYTVKVNVFAFCSKIGKMLGLKSLLQDQICHKKPIICCYFYKSDCNIGQSWIFT